MDVIIGQAISALINALASLAFTAQVPPENIKDQFQASYDSVKNTTPESLPDPQ